jgi:hypothetical protein
MTVLRHHRRLVLGLAAAVVAAGIAAVVGLSVLGNDSAHSSSPAVRPIDRNAWVVDGPIPSRGLFVCDHGIASVTPYDSGSAGGDELVVICRP